MKKLIMLLFSVLTAVCLYSNQDLENINYTWDKNPELTNIDITDTNIAIYTLKNKVSREFIVEDEGFFEYVLVHKRVKLLSDLGIDAYNKVYLPVPEEELILIEKGRVINSEGKVINLKSEDIKEGYNEENDNKYRYFAFDGIDLNSEVEYIYLYKKSPSHTGSLFNMQSEFPQNKVEFELICPDFLEFAFKSYNGLNEVETDTSLSEREKTRYWLDLDTVPGLPDQISSAHEAELMYLAYKLQKNYATGKGDLFSYGEMSKYIYDKMYEQNSKADLKFYKKIRKKLNTKNKTKEDIIREVESYLKNEVAIVDANLPDDIDLQLLWENKFLNEDLLTKIMVNILREYDIKTDIGLTCNRFDYKFDGEFENWAFTKDFLLYFPQIDQYASLSNYSRLNKPDISNIFNKGLFIKTVKVGEREFGVGEVRSIPHNNYKEDVDSLLINVEPFDDDFSEVNVNIRHSLLGYPASYIQPVLPDIDDEETKTEVLEDLISMFDGDAEVKDVEVTNEGPDDYGVKPLVLEGNLSTSALLETAGNNYIFKIGKLIGEQAEMYDDEERVLPVEDGFARKYYREISFEIPEGYEAQNLDKLQYEETHRENNETVMTFESGYERDGNTITVKITEFYRDLYYPIELFEDYRRVINAAADFNKVVVIFDKQ